MPIGSHDEFWPCGGIRRGSDVNQSKAAGPRRCWSAGASIWRGCVGRAVTEHVLNILREEIDHCLAFTGQSSFERIERSLIRLGGGATAPNDDAQQNAAVAQSRDPACPDRPAKASAVPGTLKQKDAIADDEIRPGRPA